MELFSPEDALLKVNLKIIEMFQAIYTRLFEGDRKVAKNYWTQKRCDMMPFDLL